MWKTYKSVSLTKAEIAAGIVPVSLLPLRHGVYGKVSLDAMWESRADVGNIQVGKLD